MFSSKAQIEKFRELVRDGKVTQQEFDKRMSQTQNVHALPDRVDSIKTEAKKKRSKRKVYASTKR